MNEAEMMQQYLTDLEKSQYAEAEKKKITDYLMNQAKFATEPIFPSQGPGINRRPAKGGRVGE